MLRQLRLPIGFCLDKQHLLMDTNSILVNEDQSNANLLVGLRGKVLVCLVHLHHAQLCWQYDYCIHSCDLAKPSIHITQGSIVSSCRTSIPEAF